MAHSDHSAQNAGTEQQRVIIPNKHGEKLVGLLHETGSKEIVVLCHGFRSTKVEPLQLGTYFCYSSISSSDCGPGLYCGNCPALD
ncbi:putative valacyclovir hydrolase [Corchorus olitorius]|uniref:Valacyclovir hydrolase n=1 Tax=Corchorus olitorius TaxID=93759 RepID=A0A1R3KDH9_9ROSI|nr:putative valacyclovir hydrolase [Corchorus olitorius]